MLAMHAAILLNKVMVAALGLLLMISDKLVFMGEKVLVDFASREQQVRLLLLEGRLLGLFLVGRCTVVACASWAFFMRCFYEGFRAWQLHFVVSYRFCCCLTTLVQSSLAVEPRHGSLLFVLLECLRLLHTLHGPDVVEAWRSQRALLLLLLLLYDHLFALSLISSSTWVSDQRVGGDRFINVREGWLTILRHHVAVVVARIPTTPFLADCTLAHLLTAVTLYHWAHSQCFLPRRKSITRLRAHSLLLKFATMLQIEVGVLQELLCIL